MPKPLTVKLSGKLKRVYIPGLRSAPSASDDDGEAPAVTEDMETLLEEAYRDGYRCAAGEWGSRLTEVLKILDIETSRLNSCRREFMGSLGKNVIELGVAVAEKFLISERERRIYSINAIVNDIIEKMETKSGRLTIALNPDDWAAFDEQAGLDARELFQSIRIEADPEVPQAGCRLDTGLGRVAFSLEEQIDEIRQLLAKMEVPAHETEPADSNDQESNDLPAESNDLLEKPDDLPQDPMTDRRKDPADRNAENMEENEENTVTDDQDVEALEDDGTVIEPEHAQADAPEA